MLVTLAGAMSTAELGLSLAEMIRAGQGARASAAPARTSRRTSSTSWRTTTTSACRNYRDLTPGRRAGAARAAPEPRHRHLHPRGGGDAPHRDARCSTSGSRPTRRASATSRTSSSTRSCAQRRARSSTTRSTRRTRWMLAAAEKNLPIFVPGLGGLDARQHLRRRTCIAGDVKNVHTVRTGIEYMMRLADWYQDDAPKALDRLLPDRRRHRRRLPDLRRADAAPGPAARRTCRSGATSARSATRPRATAPTRAPCRTRRSPGASSASTRRSSSSSPTRRSSRR